MTESGTKLHDDEELTTADLASTRAAPADPARDVRDPQAASSAPAAPPHEESGFRGAREPQAAPDRSAAGEPQAPASRFPERERQPAAGAAPAPGAQSAATRPAPVFAGQEVEEFRGRWSAIQIAFVDNPQEAVRDADHLVADTMTRLADTFALERSQLEQQWSSGGNLSTEDLRVALQRYRSFFDRLLAV
jgi:hypothetical protein